MNLVGEENQERMGRGEKERGREANKREVVEEEKEERQYVSSDKGK